MPDSRIQKAGGLRSPRSFFPSKSGGRVALIKRYFDKAQYYGIINKTQKIRKSLSRKGRLLTFVAFLFGALPKGIEMRKPLKTSPEGRKCMFPDCKCILSIYNHEAYCRIHWAQMPNEQKPKIPYHHYHHA